MVDVLTMCFLQCQLSTDTGPDHEVRKFKLGCNLARKDLLSGMFDTTPQRSLGSALA